MLLDDGIQLLQDDELIDLGGEVEDLLLRQGVDHTELEDGRLGAEDLAGVLIAGGGGDDAEGAVRAQLDAVEVGLLGEGGQGLHAGLDDGVAGPGVAGDHDVLGDVLDIGPLGRTDRLLRRDEALRMGDAGAELDEDGGVEPLGQLEGRAGEAAGLVGVGRLEHGQLRGDGVVAGVLLVLRGVHPGVIGGEDDHPGVHTGIGEREEGIGGDVDAHVLHHAGGALPGEGGAVGDLHGDLLVRRPLAVDVVVAGRLLGDLRAGRARIAGDDGAARLVQAAGRGGIAQHQRPHGEKDPFPRRFDDGP